MKKKSITPSTCSQSRSPCPISTLLDLVGDKWTLVLIRDMLFFEKHQYKEFADSPEKIPTNILAERLKRLEAAGFLTKIPYQHKPVRYEYHLTLKGLELFPILQEMVRWGVKHLPELPQMPPEFFQDLKRRVKAQTKSALRQADKPPAKIPPRRG